MLHPQLIVRKGVFLAQLQTRARDGGVHAVSPVKPCARTRGVAMPHDRPAWWPNSQWAGRGAPGLNAVLAIGMSSVECWKSRSSIKRPPQKMSTTIAFVPATPPERLYQSNVRADRPPRG